MVGMGTLENSLKGSSPSPRIPVEVHWPQVVRRVAEHEQRKKSNMVREARFLWNGKHPLPQELTRRNWDCEEDEPDPEKRSKRRRRPRQAPASETEAERKSSPEM